MSWPSTRTTPEVGVTLPLLLLFLVVLPAPLGPSSAKISPWPMSRSTLLSACKPDSYVLVSFEMEMMDDMAASLASTRGPMNCRNDGPALRRTVAMRRAERDSVLCQRLPCGAFLLGRFPFRRHVDPSTPSKRKTDGYRLLGGPCAVLAFAHMLDLFAHEFTGLCGRRLSFPLFLAGTFDGFLLRHGQLLCYLHPSTHREYRSRN